MNPLLEPGQTFAGRYRVERLLAQGGFGAVYLAEQVATELRVALKVLWPQVLNSEEAADKFKLEARVSARIPSEHIVRVFDAGLEEGTRVPFLVMELLIGEDLQRAVERHGPFDSSDVVSYIRQTASGLDRAHGYVNRKGDRAPIVHRDLKPENLFRTQRDDGSPLIKILDFGIAKVLGTSHRVSQEFKGTPLFMAYEQAGGGNITPQTDIWSLGLIAFFLLTGKYYWNAASRDRASLTQLFGEVLTLPLPPPSQRARERGLEGLLPPAFDDWFSSCVNRDPSQRFASAGEAGVALHRVFSQTPTPVIVVDRGAPPSPVPFWPSRSPSESPPGTATTVREAPNGRVWLMRFKARLGANRSRVTVALLAVSVTLVVGVFSGFRGRENSRALPPASSAVVKWGSAEAAVLLPKADEPVPASAPGSPAHSTTPEFGPPVNPQESLRPASTGTAGSSGAAVGPSRSRTSVTRSVPEDDPKTLPEMEWEENDRVVDSAVSPAENPAQVPSDAGKEPEIIDER